MTDQPELLESIDHRLKMLVKLEVEKKIQGLDTNKEKVLALHGLGFSTKEMAEMIDTTPASVRGARSTLREEGDIDE